MALKTDVVRYLYECESCDTVIPAASDVPEDMPQGYHVFIRRVTKAKKHSVTGALFFCSKDCFLDGVKYRVNSLSHPVGSVDG